MAENSIVRTWAEKIVSVESIASTDDLFGFLSVTKRKQGMIFPQFDIKVLGACSNQ